MGDIVLKQQGGKTLAHVPFDEIGEHAQENMGPDVIGCIHVHRTDIQNRPGAAESPLDAAWAPVGSDRPVGGYFQPLATILENLLPKNSNHGQEHSHMSFKN